MMGFLPRNCPAESSSCLHGLQSGLNALFPSQARPCCLSPQLGCRTRRKIRNPEKRSKAKIIEVKEKKKKKKGVEELNWKTFRGIVNYFGRFETEFESRGLCKENTNRFDLHGSFLLSYLLLSL